MIEYYYITISYSVIPKGYRGCISKTVTEILRFPVSELTPDEIIYSYLRVLETEWAISGKIVSFSADVDRRNE